MSKITELFQKDIQREIETVVKADDDKFTLQEIEEYVFTDEIARKFDDQDFFERYANKGNTNGVWISGFFGSGKSHLLKILSNVLEHRSVDGVNMGQLFLDKISRDDAKLKADAEKALKVPSKSILFNIDQKADVISKEQPDAVLSVFYKVFNEFCGYYGTQGHVANFERYLDKEGKLEAFKVAIQKLAGKDWNKEIRIDYQWELDSIADALSEVLGGEPTKYENILETYENNYKLSVEDFCDRVQEYIKKQGADFRLNFFVDEIGQYISDNTKLMLNLQTIAETLSTKTNGQSWIFVTSQEDMEKVIGDMNAAQQNDFSRIQARFGLKINLTSANVDEVIEKRLLSKTEPAQKELATVFKDEEQNLTTVYRFTEGLSFRGYQDVDDYLNKYPFVPYQFDLFQLSLKALSAHNAFLGKHSSVGERSMLGVFQEVLKDLKNEETGIYVTFDMLYEGIQLILKSELKSAINLAHKHLDSKLAKSVLKALFMVKYVNNFHATQKNIEILMMPSPNIDFKEHSKNIREALNILEQNTFIQRNGEKYEFLTDDEKDVEEEIKGTDVDSSEVITFLNEVVFDGLLSGDTKFRYNENKYDYEFGKRIDESDFGRPKELTINILTPNYYDYDNEDAIKLSSLANLQTMYVKMAYDDVLMKDIRLFIQTNKYVRQKNSASIKASLRSILMEKQEVNTERKRTLVNLIGNLISQGDIYLNGTPVEKNSSSEAKTVIQNAFQKLVMTAYPYLKMLGNVAYSEDTIRSTINSLSDSLFANDESAISEAENAIITILQRRKGTQQRTTINDLKEILFAKPYGWYQNGVFTNIAKLYKRGKIELRGTGNDLLNDSEAITALTNNRQFAITQVDLQIDFDQNQVKQLKELFREFFDESCPVNEPKDIACEFQDKLKDAVKQLKSLQASKNHYPFLSVLDEVIENFERITSKEYSYFLTDIKQYEDTLMDAKEDYIEDIITFWNGEQKKIYDSIVKFTQNNSANFDYLASDELNALLALSNNKTPYKGNTINSAKSSLDALKIRENELLEVERATAKIALENALDRLTDNENFGKLNETEQHDVCEPIGKRIKLLEQQQHIANIRLSVQDVESKILTEQLNKIGQIVAKREAEKQAKQTASTTANQSQVQDTKDKPYTPTVAVQYVSQSSVKVPFSKTELQSKEDISAYVKAYEAELVKLIDSNKRISL